MRAIYKYVLVALALGLVLIGVYYSLQRKKVDADTASASSATASYNDWAAGTYSASEITVGAGNIELNLAGGLDLMGLYTADNSRVTATINQGTVANAFDHNNFTSWAASFTGVDHTETLTFDLGSTFTIKTLYENYQEDCNQIYYQYSVNGSDWTNFAACGGGAGDCTIDLGAGVTARYLRNLIHIGTFACGDPSVAEMQVTGSNLGTHASSTIDGGENFWSWDSNTIAQTVPANTTATYQYRTSANGTDWTAWVGAIGSVTNRTGDDSNNPTRYRYLQVKATLTNTDGVSTPTIDSYTIDYHTEIKPTPPSAQTAVVQ